MEIDRREELGAAFLCGKLGITSEPRPDHAQYLDHWLTVMKADKKAIFTAASKASEAARAAPQNSPVVLAKPTPKGHVQ